MTTSSSIYSLFFLLCFSSGETPFHFQTLTNLKLLGDAHIYNNTTIRLTGDPTVPNAAAGRVLYNKPVTFRRPGNPNPTSFVTHFSFSILDLNPNSIGGGLAFVISPDDTSIGAAGGYLGIPANSVAVEFDTVKDLDFADVDGNHVGLDINSTASLKYATLDSVNLRSGELIHAWVEYSGSIHQLKVFVSYAKTKPVSPVLSVTIDLSRYVDEFMYVGFSGSTQGSTEVHSVSSWSFISFFDGPNREFTQISPPPPPPPKSSPLNPMPTSMMPPMTTNSAQKYRNQVKQIIVMVCAFLGILSVGGIGITIYFTRGKTDETRYCNICNWCSNVNN